MLNILHSSTMEATTTLVYNSLLLVTLVFVINMFFSNETLSYKNTFLVLVSLYTLLFLLGVILLLGSVQLVEDVSVNTTYCGYINVFNFYIEPLNLLSDRLTLVFSVTTIIISIGSNTYSFVYLNNDKNRYYFLGLLNFFIFSMLLLVHTTSLFTILFCWEGLGISSFFLINYYSKRPLSLKASFKAFSFNRVSDLFFFIFFILFYWNTNSSTILNSNYTNVKVDSVLCYAMLALTASIKSAQHIFFFWLPDSMEAPIPASALIHSATLVAAGIYLILRLSNYFENTFWVNTYFVFSGIISAVIFSFISFLQTDIKRLLAYSTIANCGFIYFLLGLGCHNLAIFYFSIHGIFKSLLFLAAGNLILINKHTQDFQFWKFNTPSINSVNILILGFFFLGSLNFSLSFEVKHFICNNHVFQSSTAIKLFNYLFLIYSVNSILYSFKLPIVLVKRMYISKVDGSCNIPNTFTVEILFFIYVATTALIYNLFFSQYLIVSYIGFTNIIYIAKYLAIVIILAISVRKLSTLVLPFFSVMLIVHI